ncbi:MAG: RNA-binding domain-containing protein [Cyanophyceae cyanobacterium]
MDIETLLEQLSTGENGELEFKSAQGGLPKDMWRTVSAFANTGGGLIILGIAEQETQFVVSGVSNVNAQLKEFWNNHNNAEKLSIPICSASDVTVETIEGKSLILIRIPRVDRKQRPVYINKNRLAGTYKRNYEGDYRCTQDEIDRMVRDASDQPQDLSIFDKYGLEDIDRETLKAFRQRFSSRDPDHPWLALDDKELLNQLGGWKRDRRTGKEGLTRAGLLMFGKHISLREISPNHHLDYQERLSDDPDERWTFRITFDGKWEPNLFNFYYRIYDRLVQDVAVPFQLDEKAVRKGETHIHEALREALVNTLIHADHSSSRPITVVKGKNAFLFLNPGLLRVPLSSLYEGGFSDPRNPNLQTMFQMIGLGEKAGSGFSKILRAWNEQSYQAPRAYENRGLDMTAVILPLVSLIPEETEKALKSVVGADNYRKLSELDRTVLGLACRDGQINNSSIQEYSNEHPREIGACLTSLVKRGWLDKVGEGRGTLYSLPNTEDANLFSLFTNSDSSLRNSIPRAFSSEHSDAVSEHSDAISEHSDAVSEHSDAELLDIAAAVRGKKRVNPELMRITIQKLCSVQYLSIEAIAKLLDRSPDTIRTHYLNPMLKEGLLELRFPDKPRHKEQAYGSPQQ